MKKHLKVLALILSTVAFTTSLVFIFSTQVFAFGKCRAEIECLDGSTRYCELDQPGQNVSCSTSANCVECKTNNQPALEPNCCPGGDN